MTSLLQLPHIRRLLANVLLAATFVCGSVGAHAAELPTPEEILERARAKVTDALWRRLEREPVLTVLVQFRTADIDALADLRLARGDRAAREDSQRQRVAGYRELKRLARTRLARGDAPVVREYTQLPMSAVKIRNMPELLRLLRRPEVEAVHEDVLLRHALTQSLPLIHRPPAGAASQLGAGTTVAVLDTGVDYTRPAFGSCVTPGSPATSCKVAYAQEFANQDNTLDADGHGSSVAAIALGVAPGTRIIALDVFDGDTARSSDVIAAMDWAIANRSTWNIAAMNLSLGDGLKRTSPCGGVLNPYRSAVNNALNVGIISVIAAGNEAFLDGLSSPACTPGALSVGAVYDSDIGPVNWSICSDSSTAADKVTCFSNTASYLSGYAPGAQITAAGVTFGGTSQAAPHVAGAVAALKAAFPADTPGDTANRLIAAGVPVTDSRPQSAITKPRLDLKAIFPPPPNDAFIDGVTLSATSGSQTLDNRYASKEVGEPDHAGNAGGASAWWRWTAPQDITVRTTLRLTTAGSTINTLLAVYTGEAVSALAPVAAASNPEGEPATLAVQVAAGVTYAIAVDGRDGAGGSLGLAWALDTDGDCIGDDLENATSTHAFDIDSDDDGLADSDEDLNCDGTHDAGETDPRRSDTDGDGVLDGTELGLVTAVPDPDGDGSLLGTDPTLFIPDADPTTGTSPLAPDSDGDGASDGAEDLNRNGALDSGESDPNDQTSTPQVAHQVALPPGWLAVLALVLGVVGHRAKSRPRQTR
ncbi:MAG: S8 family serine peptidase [Gammaproteobacteria bacterium]